MEEVYVYTLLTDTGELIEHHGHLYKGKGKARFINLHNPHHWMTSLSNNEGEVRGRSVWFTTPNRVGAIKALNAKCKERAEKLLARSQRTLGAMEL